MLFTYNVGFKLLLIQGSSQNSPIYWTCLFTYNVGFKLLHSPQNSGIDLE